MSATPESEGRARGTWRAFKVIWPAVCDCLTLGYTVRQVHEACVGEGVWQSGYNAFRYHVVRAKSELAVGVEPAKGVPPTAQATHVVERGTAVERPASRAPHDLLRGHPALRGNDPMMRPIERDAYRYQPSEDTKDLY